MSEYVKALEAERDHYSAQVGALKAENKRLQKELDEITTRLEAAIDEARGNSA